jgi:drug/metabolite transporter (DMT)-like permease
MFSGIALSGNMSSVAIASQLGVPFATLLSVMLLGEQIHWRRRLGIGLAFAGVLVLGFSPEILASPRGLLIVVIAAFIGAVEWSALFYSALLASLFAHTAYFALIRRHPVSSVAPVTVAA